MSCNQDEVTRVGPDPLWLVSLLEEGNLDTDTHGKNSMRWWRQRLELQAKGCQDGWPALEEARKHSLLRVSEGAWPCQHLDFGPRCFKLPSLWFFVMAALGTNIPSLYPALYSWNSTWILQSVREVQLCLLRSHRWLIGGLCRGNLIVRGAPRFSGL